MQPQFNRAGRKRKQGIRRHPGGQPVDEKINVAAICIAHPERQGLPQDKRHDMHAGTFLGRLMLQGLLSEEQVEGIRRFADAARKLQQAIGAPSPNAPAMNLLGGSGGFLILSPEEIETRQKDYDDAFCALNKRDHIVSIDGSQTTVPGHKALRAVSRVGVYGEPLPDGCTFLHLSTGATVLVHHYGLTTRKNIRYINAR